MNEALMTLLFPEEKIGSFNRSICLLILIPALSCNLTFGQDFDRMVEDLISSTVPLIHAADLKY